MGMPVSMEAQIRPDLRVLPARSSSRVAGVAKVPIQPAEEHVAFGEFLVARMETMGLSIAELVRLSGADNSTISNLRSGQAKPGIRVLKKLYKGLGMSLPELLVIAGLIDPADWPEGSTSPALPPVLRSVLSRLENPKYKQRHRDVLADTVQEVVDRWDEMIELIEEERRGRR